MKAADRISLKRAGIEVTRLGLGSAPFGGLFRPVEAREATATLDAAWAAGLRLFDTAPMYGLGRAEHLVGASLRERDRATYRLSTKVGRLMASERPGRSLPAEAPRNPMDAGWNNGLPFREVFDYSYDGVMRSVDDSQQRLGITRLDLLYVHDIGRLTHGERHADHWSALTRGGGFKALTELREAGLIAGFGLGVNETEVIVEAMDEADLDCCLLAGRYTLLDQSAGATLLSLARRRGVDIVVGGVFNSGILATGPVGQAKFHYADAPAAIVERVRRLDAVCRAHDTPLAAAALQFPLRNLAVAAVLIGAAKASEVEENVALFERTVPDALWAALGAEGLLDAVGYAEGAPR